MIVIGLGLEFWGVQLGKVSAFDMEPECWEGMGSLLPLQLLEVCSRLLSSGVGKPPGVIPVSQLP